MLTALRRRLTLLMTALTSLVLAGDRKSVV